jgi:hypothetical protein
MILKREIDKQRERERKKALEKANKKLKKISYKGKVLKFLIKRVDKETKLKRAKERKLRKEKRLKKERRKTLLQNGLDRFLLFHEKLKGKIRIKKFSSAKEARFFNKFVYFDYSYIFVKKKFLCIL